MLVCKINLYFFSCFTAVVQVVLDITTFYMQTYNKFKTTEDQRLKETLRVIHTGVSDTTIAQQRIPSAFWEDVFG